MYSLERVSKSLGHTRRSGTARPRGSTGPAFLGNANLPPKQAASVDIPASKGPGVLLLFILANT